MIVDDIKLSKKNTDPRLMQMLTQVVEILNTGSYEQKIYVSAPTASSPGFDGEVRVVRTGAVVKTYKFISGAWYYSATYTAV